MHDERTDHVDIADFEEAGTDAPLFDADTIRDRVFGAILGEALGDALGLQVEGDDPETIAERHPNGLKYPYRGSYRGYQPNDWTDATDFAVLVMRTLTAYFTGKTENPVVDFAARALRWQKSGFAELGDTGGSVPESVVARVLAMPGYARAPVEAARAVKGPKAENGALIRAVACAFTVAPEDWAVRLGEATHADPRCAASAATFALLVRDLARTPGGAPPLATMAVGPICAGRGLLAEEGRRREFVERLTATESLAGISPGARENRSYTVKTLGCAVWALRQLARAPPEVFSDRSGAFFRDRLATLAAQGGDASANCAVAGAVLGAALGREGLPADWLAALPNRAWLEKEIEDFLRAASKTWDAES